MCGIFGIVLPEGEKPEAALVEKATDSLAHRGPDDRGYFYDKNVGLGNRRLAILDLREEGHMPLEYKSCVITYNGELYNYLELKEKLIALGHVFKTRTDTEVVIVAYKEWGRSCVDRFVGMWAFAIYDKEKAFLFCSRDRFGIKPFFYTYEEGSISFASEIKAFKTLPNWKAKVNEEMVGDFLEKGILHHTNQTLFEGVFQLPAGHHLLIDCNTSKINIEQYYSLKDVVKSSSITFEVASIKFKNLLSESIEMHQRSDVKLGAALSGGLDSSTIVAIQANQQPDAVSKLEAVSYTSTIPEFDESKFVEDLLKKFPVQLHKTEGNFEETMELLDEVTIAHDEPLLSASLIAQYLVFKKAKDQGIKVMLDGQGADEILAGYGTYYPSYWKETLKKEPWAIIPEVLGMISKHGIDFKSKFRALKANTKTKYFEFPVSNDSSDLSNFSAYERYMIEKGILPYLLQFDDKNSMAHSVESRVPFLDHRLVEFCLSLPSSFKIKNGIRKRILRSAMDGDLPGSIINRFDKMGFPTPQNYWMAERPDYFLGKIAEFIKQFPKRINKSYYDFASNALRKRNVESFAGIWRMISLFRWMELNDLK